MNISTRLHKLEVEVARIPRTVDELVNEYQARELNNENDRAWMEALSRAERKSLADEFDRAFPHVDFRRFTAEQIRQLIAGDTAPVESLYGVDWWR